MTHLVVIQRGHCYRRTGATGAPGEQEYATDTAAILSRMLQEAGYLTRVINADVNNNAYRGNIFVALHYDSSTSKSAKGASVGYQNAAGKKLATLWKEEYTEAGWNRGYRADNYTANLGQYYGVSKALQVGNNAAIITEAGFITNTADKELISPRRTALAVTNAIKRYTDWKEPDEVISDADKNDIAELVVKKLFGHKLDDPMDDDNEPDGTFGGITRYNWQRSRTTDKGVATLVEQHTAVDKSGTV